MIAVARGARRREKKMKSNALSFLTKQRKLIY